MEFRDVVRRRRMRHAFEQRPVERAVLDDLLDVARRGPSAGFSQGTDFVVLDDATSIARFWELTDHPDFPRPPEELVTGPTVLVLAYADSERYLRRYAQPDKLPFGLDRAEAWPVAFWDTDTAMACMLLLLAAVDVGLGGWFFGVNHGVEELQRDLGVPSHHALIGIVGLGHALHEESPKGSAYSLARRPLDDVVHYGRW